jgi:hydrogenase-4 component F
MRLQGLAFGDTTGRSHPVAVSLAPMYTHLALVAVAGLYLPPPLVVWFQNVARLLG